jgi:hypothetical protein
MLKKLDQRWRVQRILKFSNFVLFCENRQKLANMNIFNFFHTLCIEDRALTLNPHVIPAHAFHMKKLVIYLF